MHSSHKKHIARAGRGEPLRYSQQLLQLVGQLSAEPAKALGFAPSILHPLVLPSAEEGQVSKEADESTVKVRLVVQLDASQGCQDSLTVVR